MNKLTKRDMLIGLLSWVALFATAYLAYLAIANRHIWTALLVLVLVLLLFLALWLEDDYQQGKEIKHEKEEKTNNQSKVRKVK